MSLRENEEIMQLAAKHPELMKLVQEHEELDKKVSALDKRHVRTPAETMERKQLSKLKLASRDRITAMVAKIKQEY